MSRSGQRWFRLRADAFEWEPTVERLIAFVRLLLAAGALVVVWLDPTQPSHHAQVAYAGFGVYVLYSAAVFRLARGRPRPWLPIFTQIADLMWVPPVLYFTEAANTPFFVFFVIFIFTAGIRWGRWVAWAVSVYSLVIYLALLFVSTPHPDLNNDLMRIGYLLIIGVLGGYLVEYRRRREAELGILRTMSSGLAAEPSAATAMSEIVRVVREQAADSVIGLIRHTEGTGYLLFRGSAEPERVREEEAGIFLRGLANAGGDESWGGRMLREDDPLLGFADATEGAAYPIRTGAELVGGVYFFSSAGRRTERDVRDFVGLLLRHVIPHVETLYLLERTREARVMDERRRIARDLHDSFIQALAALGLRLSVLRSLVDAAGTSPPVLGRELDELHGIVGQEIRRVRAYIAEMREPISDTANVADLLMDVAAEFRARTRIAIELSAGRELALVSHHVGREIAPLLREALTNVGKHARAARVRVVAQVDGGDLRLVVEDDGVGIDPARLGSDGAQGQGLRSMGERAHVLGGTLSIEPGPAGGTRVVVVVPLAASASRTP